MLKSRTQTPDDFNETPPEQLDPDQLVQRIAVFDSQLRGIDRDLGQLDVEAKSAFADSDPQKLENIWHQKRELQAYRAVVEASRLPFFSALSEHMGALNQQLENDACGLTGDWRTGDSLQQAEALMHRRHHLAEELNHLWVLGQNSLSVGRLILRERKARQ